MFPDDARLPAGQRILGAALCSRRAAGPAAPGDGEGTAGRAGEGPVLPRWGVPVGFLGEFLGVGGVFVSGVTAAVPLSCGGPVREEFPGGCWHLMG